MDFNTTKSPHVGFQTFLELYGCDAAIINDAEQVKEILLQAAKRLNLTVVNSLIHHFSPIGVSGVIVIQESHIAVHTWPELNYVALDFFTCNQQYNITEISDFLKNKFGATQIETKNIQRGELNTINQFTSKNKTHVR